MMVRFGLSKLVSVVTLACLVQVTWAQTALVNDQQLSSEPLLVFQNAYVNPSGLLGIESLLDDSAGEAAGVAVPGPGPAGAAGFVLPAVFYGTPPAEKTSVGIPLLEAAVFDLHRGYENPSGVLYDTSNVLLFSTFLVYIPGSDGGVTTVFYDTPLLEKTSRDTPLLEASVSDFHRSYENPSGKLVKNDVDHKILIAAASKLSGHPDITETGGYVNPSGGFTGIRLMM